MNYSMNKVQVSYFLSCHNQISPTTQIPQPFPDFGPFPDFSLTISEFPESSIYRNSRKVVIFISNNTLTFSNKLMVTYTWGIAWKSNLDWCCAWLQRCWKSAPCRSHV